MTEPHSRLLTEAARRHLRPLGVTQKARSRTWLDDRGWFVANVEFQPSGWSKGSYLNVGAHFLWTWNGFLSFDLGSRIEGFVPSEGFVPTNPRTSSPPKPTVWRRAPHLRCWRCASAFPIPEPSLRSSPCLGAVAGGPTTIARYLSVLPGSPRPPLASSS